MSRLLSVLTIALVLFSLPLLVRADDVDVYAAKDANFASYKTYLWEKNVVVTRFGVQEDEPTLGPMIRDAVVSNLKKKGLTETADAPDLIIRTYGLNSTSPQLEAIIYSAAVPVDWAVGSPITTVGRYNREGTLVINMIDAKTEKSVWLGMVTKALGKPSKMKNDIEKAAEKLIKKYPSGK